MAAGQGGTETSVNTRTYTRMHRLKTKSYSIIVKSQKKKHTAGCAHNWEVVAEKKFCFCFSTSRIEHTVNI